MVLKEPDLVDRRLEAQAQGLLVVELEGERSPMVLAAGSFDARGEVVPEFVGIGAAELAEPAGSPRVRGLEIVRAGHEARPHPDALGPEHQARPLNE